MNGVTWWAEQFYSIILAGPEASPSLEPPKSALENARAAVLGLKEAMVPPEEPPDALDAAFGRREYERVHDVTWPQVPKEERGKPWTSTDNGKVKERREAAEVPIIAMGNRLRTVYGTDYMKKLTRGDLASVVAWLDAQKPKTGG